MQLHFLRRSIITRRSSSVKESNSASQMSVICLVLPALKSGSQLLVFVFFLYFLVLSEIFSEDCVSKKIVFSGDVGNIDQPIIKDPQHVDAADYLVIESTYGNRVHSTVKPDYIKDLTRVLRETFAKGGNVVIPSFAVGRTQEHFYFIREIKENYLLPE